MEQLSLPHVETIVDTKLRQFNQLSQFLEHWYYKPDMDAVKICLSTYVAHTYLADNPVWLFIIGPPGSGKTSVAIRSISFLPQTHMIGNLSENSFLSGFGVNNGILGKLTLRHNGNGVLLFPDFTSLLDKRDFVRNEIAGQMRLIYDGYYSKEVGNKDESIVWKGKVTCLAAVTPALEHYWSINRSLGERFMYLRWENDNGEGCIESSKRQVGKERVIEDEFRKRILEYVDVDSLRAVEIEDNEQLGLNGICSMVSILRTNVHREVGRGGKRTITDVDVPEAPTRISKMLTMIARGSATLDRRKKIDFYDLCLAKRVAIDSIPSNRCKVIKALIDNINYSLTFVELKEITGACRAVIERTIEDLIELKVVTITTGAINRWVNLLPEYCKAWEDSIIVKVDHES
jgi:hypothetical protein